MVPPFTGVAVKVTFAPAQIVVALADIETVGVTVDVTVMVMVFEVTVAGDAQDAVDVISQVTVAPLVNEVVV